MVVALLENIPPCRMRVAANADATALYNDDITDEAAESSNQAPRGTKSEVPARYMKRRTLILVLPSGTEVNETD